MITAIHKMVDACRQGTYDAMLKRMSSGWAVMGSSQFLNGYCLLLPDPVVPHLNIMDTTMRHAFLADMAILGDAVLSATGALRINYAMFGNAEPALHAHIIPRFDNEPEAMRAAHPWTYDWSAAPQFELSIQGRLHDQIRQCLGS